jgi:ribonuclease VapC
MIVDSSAVVSVFLREPGWSSLFDHLASDVQIGIGAPTLVETGIVLSARLQRDAVPLLARFMQEFEITSIPFGDLHWQEAVHAYTRFGKGRHPAGRNFGDCMSYATARVAGQALLYIGDDFSKTDIERVS